MNIDRIAYTNDSRTEKVNGTVYDLNKLNQLGERHKDKKYSPAKPIKEAGKK